MKKLILLLTLMMGMMSCSVSEKPEFLYVKNIEVSESTAETITLTADAFFKNPNDVGGELKADGIKVFVNDNEMATISTESFKVPAQQEFSIPLKAQIPTDSLLSDKNLTGLLGSLFNQKMKVQYKGNIKYKVFLLSHTYPLDQTQEIKIKL